MNAVPGNLVYTPARRANVGVMIMLAGPSGAGKTLSALKLARGLAGPTGKIAFADTENGRALYYADDHQFDHLALQEPFRPAKFEQAAMAAVQQKADVWICDSFTHEHNGPGGLLEYFEDELKRLVPDDNYQRRDAMKMVAWIKPKGDHKHMLQRLWQLNRCHIVLCVQAEKKIEMQMQTEGKSKGKVIPVAIGYQPICGNDVMFAMTMAFMLEVDRPGVPVVLKPLLPDLVPLIPLDRPLSIETGARIAAWARGDKPAVKSPPPPAAEADVYPGKPPPPLDPNPPPREVPTAEAEPEQLGGPPPDDAEEVGLADDARDLATLFAGTKDRASHLAIAQDKTNQAAIQFLRRNHPKIYDREVAPAMADSWRRTDPKNQGST